MQRRNYIAATSGNSPYGSFISNQHVQMVSSTIPQQSQVFPGQHQNVVLATNPYMVPISHHSPQSQQIYQGYPVQSWDPNIVTMQYALQQQQQPQQMLMYTTGNKSSSISQAQSQSHYQYNPNNVVINNQNNWGKRSNKKKGGNERNKKVEENEILRNSYQHPANTFSVSIPSLSELRGNVINFSKDQFGCRLLQNLIDSGDQQYYNLIFEESMPFLRELLMDSFGNYLFQKLISSADSNNRTMMLQVVQPILLTAALNLHGTRSVQKIIEICCNNEIHIEIISSALRQNAVKLCIDRNGNHVIQKCLKHFNTQETQFIFSSVIAACLEICTQRHGCCVVQRCLDSSRDAQGNMPPYAMDLIKEIINHCIALMQHQYGNYVVQYVLDISGPDVVQNICLATCSLLVPLSMQKFASNVVEKIIIRASMDSQNMLIDKLVENDNLSKLIEDQYGNYVIQSALDSLASNPASLRLVTALRPLVSGIRNTSGGRRILARLLKNYSIELPEEEVAAAAAAGIAVDFVQSL